MRTSSQIHLRSTGPQRPLVRWEALRVAELQATQLLRLCEISEPPVPESIVADLPRLTMQRLSPIPVSGSAHWAKSRWVVVLNGDEPRTRQRFTLMHEFKHILDNPFVRYLYTRSRGMSPDDQAEQICDYFAACTLMPRGWVKRAWGDGIQDFRELARLFDVSDGAMAIRLLGLGLVPPRARTQRRIIR